MSAKKTKTATTLEEVERQPHRYPTRSKLRRNTRYLPTEVIFQILIFLPAKSLFDAARYVCKQWYDIVTDPDFIKAHSQLSTPGFLIRNSYYRDSHMTFIDANTPNTTKIQIPPRVKEIFCFNGLVLFSSLSSEEILLFHVVNPVTKENISLPPVADGKDRMVESTASLSVDSHGHYKVVFAFYTSTFYEDILIKMGLFTIGIDKEWRFLDLEGSATLITIGTSLGFMLTEGFIWRLWKLTDVKSGEFYW
ncbi:F-box protein At5g49610-like [Silene latifolia]|uniref:F-box protein At5g49610-like n=1 Tax=Silene latifolia TaxID=37657 RepID=UPI003D78A9CC